MGPWRVSLAVVGALSLVAALLGAASVTAGAVGTAQGQGSIAVTGNSCNGVFHGNPPGSLAESSPAGPNGSTVMPGQPITVTLTWNPSDFGGSPPSKTDLCVEIGSAISATLSQEHKPGPNGATDTFRFTAPPDTGGEPICIRTAVSGLMTSTEKSGVLCYAELPAMAPEAPSALLFPVAGLCIVVGVLLARRYFARRHARFNPH